MGLQSVYGVLMVYRYLASIQSSGKFTGLVNLTYQWTFFDDLTFSPFLSYLSQYSRR